MSNIILHSYDASPFTQRALRMLGIKGLRWRWVKTPMAPPKDDLVRLTGGYRGTPVMQIGADIYVDSQLIAAELERRHPDPTLFPAGDQGLAFLLVKFGDAFFMDSMSLVAELMSAHFPEPFLEDREHVFGRWGFDALAARFPQACAQLRAQAQLLDHQLADGRPFLTGDAAGLADIQAFSVPWFVRGSLNEIADKLWAGFDHMAAWEARVDALGEGTREEIGAAEALKEAQKNQSVVRPEVPTDDPEGLVAGAQAEVRPLDTRRGTVRGELVAAGPNHVALRNPDSDLSNVVVHLPRLNYQIHMI